MKVMPYPLEDPFSFSFFSRPPKESRSLPLITALPFRAESRLSWVSCQEASNLSSIRRTRRYDGGNCVTRPNQSSNQSPVWHTDPQRFSEINFSGIEIHGKRSDHHNELIQPPLYSCFDLVSSDQARPDTSTWQFANADGDYDSLNPIPHSFDFELSLDSQPPLPELSENLTQSAIDPRRLGLSNNLTLGTSFEDGRLQQPLASSRPLPSP